MPIKKLLIITTSFLFCCVGFANEHGNKINSKTNELHNVSQQIKGLQKSINKDRDKQTSLQKDLRNTEISISHISQAIINTDIQLKKQSTSLKSLLEKQLEQEALLNQRKTALLQNIKTAYMLGHHDYLKLLLNPDTPDKLNRMLVYYKYIDQAHLKIIKQLDQTISEIKNTQFDIRNHTIELQSLEAQQQKDQHKLSQKLIERKAILSSVENSITTKSQKLQELIANKRALEQLIKRLKVTSFSFSQPSGSISKLRGKLLWPTQGRLTQHFGSLIPDTNMAANSVFIQAPAGQAIHAIYPGKVVFADWLRGLGLLLIIDHGHGFMSLYGHNHSLNKANGAFVNAGDIIAYVGQSGGNNQSGLYFQLRQNGQPLNPEQWCRG
ncbi:MAG: murein hydrolase activator EnvC [Gammaproteobacteria bacterium]